MKRWWVSLAVLLLSLSSAMAQSAGQQAPNAPPSDTESAATSSAGMIRGSFPIMLPKGIDSKKLKDGDTVICQTAAPLSTSVGIIPSGSKVVGHVTQAKARSKGDPESTLGLAFDKIEYKKGKEAPMKATLQAVGPSVGDSSGPSTGAAGPGHLGGRGDTSFGTTAPPTPSNMVPGPKPIPILTPTSEGVLGIKNLEMNKDGVLTSPNKEVKLDSGMQLLIRAEIQVPTQ